MPINVEEKPYSFDGWKDLLFLFNQSRYYSCKSDGGNGPDMDLWTWTQHEKLIIGDIDMSCHRSRKGGPGTHPRGQVLNDRRTGCEEELKFSAFAARSSSNSHPAFDPAPNCSSSSDVGEQHFTRKCQVGNTWACVFFYSCASSVDWEETSMVTRLVIINSMRRSSDVCMQTPMRVGLIELNLEICIFRWVPMNSKGWPGKCKH